MFINKRGKKKANPFQMQIPVSDTVIAISAAGRHFRKKGVTEK